MASKEIALGTDVATFALFHPDDLAHRDEDPIAWYAYDFAYRRESAAGRLVAFGTGSDGGFLLRLTTEGLTSQERRRAVAYRTFPYRVRHGRVLLDNTDALPGLERMSDPADRPDDWFDLPNGPYRVAVHAIDRFDPAGEDDPDGSPVEGLPDYVVLFEAGEADGVEVAAGLPDLRPVAGLGARITPSMDTPSPFARSGEPPAAGTHPALPVDDADALVPGQQAGIAVEQAVFERLTAGDDGFGDRFVVAVPAEGALGVLCRLVGFSQRGSERPCLKLAARHVVRLVARPAAAADRASPARVAVAPVAAPPTDEDGLGADALARLQRKLAAHVENRPDLRRAIVSWRFEIERLESLRSLDEATGWALMRLDWPLDRKLAAYVLAPRERLARIEAFLDTGALPPAPAGPPPDEESRGLLARLSRLLGA